MAYMDVQLERDVYSRCVNIAKNYYTLLHRRNTLEADRTDETARKTERLIGRRREIDRKIHALDACTDTYDRQLIQKNLFEQVPLAHLDLPMSERTMKRRRKAFLVHLAENLDEI